MPPLKKKSSIDSLIKRINDTGNFLTNYLVPAGTGRGQIHIQDKEEFFVKILSVIALNQAAMMTYFLEREGYVGIPVDNKNNVEEEK